MICKDRKSLFYFQITISVPSNANIRGVGREGQLGGICRFSMVTDFSCSWASLFLAGALHPWLIASFSGQVSICSDCGDLVLLPAILQWAQAPTECLSWEILFAILSGC